MHSGNPSKKWEENDDSLLIDLFLRLFILTKKKGLRIFSSFFCDFFFKNKFEKKKKLNIDGKIRFPEYFVGCFVSFFFSKNKYEKNAF